MSNPPNVRRSAQHPEPDDYEVHLLNDLRQILQPLREHNYSYESTALDIFFAYRLLLSRAPESVSAAELAERAATFPDISRIKLAFLNSPEFRTFYYGACSRPEGRAVIVPDGPLRIAVSPDDLIIGWSVINGNYEPSTRSIIEQFVRPGMTCIDLGANCGFFTSLLGHLVGPTGAVHAYEPFETVHALLQRTIQESNLRGIATGYPLAASDRAGTAILYSVPDLQMGGSYVSTAEIKQLSATTQQREIRLIKLDEHLAQINRLDFIKMDIEGSEVRALNGMAKLINRFRPLVLTEVSAATLSRNGATREDLFAFFQQRGYTSFAIDERPGARATTRQITSPLEIDEDDNVLMAPSPDAIAPYSDGA